MPAVRPLVVAIFTTALVLASTAPPAGASPEGPASEKEPLPSGGHCVEVALGVRASAEKVRPFIPDDEGFTLQEAGGETLLVVFGEDCTASAGDDPPERMFLGSITAQVAHPAGDGGYNITWTTSGARYFSKLRTMGFGELAPHATFTAHEEPRGVTRSAVKVPGGFSPFSFSAVTATTAGDAGVPFRSTNWSNGPFGPVKCVYDHDVERIGTGAGTLWPEPRTPLAAMVGPGPVEAVAGFFVFTFAGTCELIEGDPA